MMIPPEVHDELMEALVFYEREDPSNARLPALLAFLFDAVRARMQDRIGDVSDEDVEAAFRRGREKRKANRS